MFQSASEQLSSVRIGTVQYVAPDQIRATLDSEAPESVALNTGEPRPFPRVNGYLLITVDADHLVGQVEWITAEQTASPLQRGRRDTQLVDLPKSLRRLRINPLGMLRNSPTTNEYLFQRGAEALPSVGAAVILPSESQLKAIIDSGEPRHVKIGTSPLAGDAVVAVDPNKLFGRHLAVLGNTGSGKSCSVAGLIRWSLEQAQRPCVKRPNARFIILDPNGEYSSAFEEKDALETRVFRVKVDGDGIKQLKVPLWFWNSAEWASFAQASARTQGPFLRRALREIKSDRSAITEDSTEEKQLRLRRYLSSRLISIRSDFRSGAIQMDENKFGFRLKAIASDLEIKIAEFPSAGLGKIRNAIASALKAAYNSFTDKRTGEFVEYYRAFPEAQIEDVMDAFEESLDGLGGVVYHDGPGENTPLPFKGTDLADHVEMIAMQDNVSQFVDFLVARIRMFLADPTLRAIVDQDEEFTLTQWLNEYLGDSNDEEGSCVSVIDLSLVPSDVVHIVTAVIARMIFEALQRYMDLNGSSLPTVLVMEEAHTFIKRYRDDHDYQDAAAVCCRAFERIAREGRKFGLGLILSSQRPSELSPSVLSQCNTFLLHRISNDRDQELVNRLVPDNLRGLLRELPSLPTRNAVLLGWATELPVLVRMNELPSGHQPRSDDPEFWKVWVRESERKINWQAIAADWQETARETEEQTGSGMSENNAMPIEVQPVPEDEDWPWP